MVRHYQRKNDKKRTYKYCSEEKLQQALKAVAEGMSFRQAARAYDVKPSTLCDRFNGKHGHSVGRPKVIPEEIEQLIAEMFDQIAEWGYPCGTIELQLIVKDILERQNIEVCSKYSKLSMILLLCLV